MNARLSAEQLMLFWTTDREFDLLKSVIATFDVAARCHGAWGPTS